MNFKHIQMLDGNVAEIRLFDVIGTGSNTASSIAQEIDFLTEIEGAKEILVLINSPGGNMFEGFGIFRALERAKEKGIVVNTEISGLAASMAQWLSLVGMEISMVDFGILMLHSPLLLDGNKPTAEQKVMLEKFNEAAIIVMVAKTGLKKHELEQMMEGETWLNAEEALALGLVDKIIETKKDAPVKVKESKMEEIVTAYMSLTKPPAPTPTPVPTPTPISKPNININMKIIAIALGLDANTAEAAVSAKVSEIVSKVSTLEANVLSLETEKTKLSDQVTKLTGANNEALATVLVESAIKAGKIAADKKDDMIKLGQENVELLKTTLESIKAPTMNLAKMLETDTGGTAEIKEGKYNGKTYRELDRESPSTLTMLREKHPDVHAELFKVQYGKFPSNYKPESV